MAAEIPSSPLMKAALGLHEALERFEHLVESVQKAPLTSQKGIERAAKMLQDIVDLEATLEGFVRGLVDAVTQLRVRQEEQAKAAHARALELQERTTLLQGLLERYGSLGRQATELNTTLQGVDQRRRTEANAEGDRAAANALEPLLHKMSDVAEGAKSLAEDATAQDFDDISRQADSLRQQILSARNKLDLLRQKLSAN